MEKETIQDCPESAFGGFSLSSIYSLRTPKLTFSIEDPQDNAYSTVIEVLNGLN